MRTIAVLILTAVEAEATGEEEKKEEGCLLN
jgi:hypothetical protein